MNTWKHAYAHAYNHDVKVIMSNNARFIAKIKEMVKRCRASIALVIDTCCPTINVF